MSTYDYDVAPGRLTIFEGERPHVWAPTVGEYENLTRLYADVTAETAPYTAAAEALRETLTNLDETIHALEARAVNIAAVEIAEAMATGVDDVTDEPARDRYDQMRADAVQRAAELETQVGKFRALTEPWARERWLELFSKCGIHIGDPAELPMWCTWGALRQVLDALDDVPLPRGARRQTTT